MNNAVRVSFRRWGIFLAALVLLGIALQQTPRAARSSCVAPFVTYSTTLGGELMENGNDVVVGGDGQTHIGGTTFSNLFPTARQTEHGVDAVAVALQADGSALASAIWVNPPTFNAEDEGLAIGIDGANNRYLVGRTDSADFCDALGVSLPGFDTTFNGGGDGFLIKIDPDGIVASCSYIGGDQFDLVRDVAVTSAGEVFLTGGTWSAQSDLVPFPVTTGVAHAGLRDVFVMKFNADGTLAYSTLLGGTSQDEGQGIAVNASGEAFVAGWSNSADLPTLAALDATANGSFDAFAFQLSADGTTRRFVTYLGGGDEDRAYGVAVDAGGAMHIVGTTRSADFPTSTDAFQTAYGGVGLGGHDAFLTTLTPDGSMLRYSTYFGGTGEERAYDVVASGADLLLTGFTQSADFATTPVTIATALNGTQDAFLIQLTNYRVQFSTLWGGSDEETGNGLALHGGELYWVGESRSADFCATADAYDATPNGDYDIFLTRLVLPRVRVYLPIVHMVE